MKKRIVTMTAWMFVLAALLSLCIGFTLTASAMEIMQIAPCTVYTVTLHKNEGTVTSGDITEYAEGLGATLPTAVEREGYVFYGWYDNAAFTGVAVTAITSTDSGNKTFYARWEKLHDVYVGGVQVNDAILNDVLGDGGSVKYDPATHTLTLTDATIVNAGGHGIYAYGINLTVHGVDTDADGSNAITGTAVVTSGVDEYGDPYTLTEGGNGIYTEGNGYSGNGGLTLTGTLGKITGDEGNSISAYEDIVVQGTVGDLVCTGGLATGIASDFGDVSITATATVGGIDAEYNGIAATNVTIAGTVGDITVGNTGIHVSCGTVAISGTAGKITGGAVGIEAYKTVSDWDENGDPIYVGGTVTVSGTVGKITGEYCGIFAEGDLKIDSTTVEIAARDMDSYALAIGGGLYQSDVIVSLPVNYQLGSVETNPDQWDTTICDSADNPALAVKFEPGFEVSFDAYPSLDYIESQQIPTGGKAVKPATPICSGYSFVGWYTDADCTSGNEYKFDTVLTENILLYAKWKTLPPSGSVTILTHSCTSVCKTCGGCMDAKCTKKVCKDKCLTISMAFTDVAADAWYAESVGYVYHHGIMKGVSQTEFDVDGSATRAMIVTTLWRLEGEPVVNYLMRFEDVSQDAWYAEAVRWATSEGIVLGYSTEEFCPDASITREQMAAILYRYAQYKGVAPTGAWAIRLEYTDLADIAEYASESVMYCTLKNLMQSRDGGLFAPKATASRAEIAVALHRFLVNNK